MQKSLTFVSGAMRLLFLILKIVGFAVLVAALVVLLVVGAIAFFIFALAVQEYRAHITLGIALCCVVLALRLLRPQRATQRKKEDQ